MENENLELSKKIEDLKLYIDKVEMAMLKQWNKMNNSISAFEQENLIAIDRLEELQNKMITDSSNLIKKSFELSQEIARNEYEKISELSILLRDKFSYMATSQNLEEITRNCMENSLKHAANLINKDLWDDKIGILITFISGITKSVENLSKVVSLYEENIRKEPITIFKIATNLSNPFFDLEIISTEINSCTSVRLHNILKKTNCKNMREVFYLSANELKEKGAGLKILRELQSLFAKHKISWELNHKI